MEFEQMKEIREAAEKASEDDKPYAVVVDEKVHVLGDPNLADHTAHNYTLTFSYPKIYKDKIEYKIVKETEEYVYFEKEYKDVYISSRRTPAVVAGFARIYAWLRNFEPTGEAEMKSDGELYALCRELSQEVDESVYDAIGTVFKLTDEEKEWLLLPSAITTLLLLFADHPDLANGGDAFLG